MDLIYKSTATRQQQLSSYPQPSHSHHVLSRLRLVLHFPPRPSCVPARHRGRASHQGRSRDTDEHICGVHNWGKRSHALRSGLANKSTECWRPSTPAGVRSGNYLSCSERAPSGQSGRLLRVSDVCSYPTEYATPGQPQTCSLLPPTALGWMLPRHAYGRAHQDQESPYQPSSFPEPY